MKHYFTADLHLGHKKMADMRGFKSVDDMNRILINNINATVWPGEHLWILGDFSYKISKDEARELLQQIKCQHIHLLKGNHDKDWSTDDGWESVDDYVELKTDWGKIPLFHYPMMAWNGMLGGAYHFHGHIHSNADQNLQNAKGGIHRYDVGIDANNYLPVYLDDIITRMRYIESMAQEGYPVDEIETADDLPFPIRPLQIKPAFE